jgi:hypothetical protein
MIASFTIVLAAVGFRQARLIAKSIALAREEFNATHRPHIVVRDVVKDGDNILYLLVNKGDSPAIIIESYVLAEFVPDGQALQALRSAGYDCLGRLSLTVGEVKEATYKIQESHRLASKYPDRKVGVTGESAPAFGSFYFTGTIVYEDGSGHRRRSVFRRRWNGKSGGFEQLENPAYEYED